MSTTLEPARAPREQTAECEQEGQGSVLIVEDSLVDARLAAMQFDLRPAA